MSPAELAVVVLMSGMLVVGLVLLSRRPTPVTHVPELQMRGGAPQPAELQAISERLSTVERLCDVVRAEISGVKDSMQRVERTTDMLLKRQIEGDHRR